MVNNIDSTQGLSSVYVKITFSGWNVGTQVFWNGLLIYVIWCGYGTTSSKTYELWIWIIEDNSEEPKDDFSACMLNIFSMIIILFLFS